jgi:6-phosphogluconolactonase
VTRLEDGIPVETVDVVEGLEGCHSANISPDNRTLWVPALKQDRICLFTLSDDGHLVAQSPAEVTPLRARPASYGLPSEPAVRLRGQR